jgi:hypothetical protein
MRSMGLWEMLLRAALAKNGRWIKRGAILIALVDVLVDAHAALVGDLAAALYSLVVASSVSPSETII